MYFEIGNFLFIILVFSSLSKVNIYGNPKTSEKSVLQIRDLVSYSEGFMFDPDEIDVWKFLLILGM